MKFTLTRALFKLHLITPLGFIILLYCFLREGLTLMAILRFTRIYYSGRTALVSENDRLNYSEVYEKAMLLTRQLYGKCEIKQGMQVGVLCRNHTTSALLLSALSRLGAHIRLLNTDIGSEKMATLLAKKRLDCLIFDDELREKCVPAQVGCKCITTEQLDSLLYEKTNVHLPHISRGGQISVLTGGSSGNYKEAARNTGLYQFIPPFFALLKDIKIQDYNSVFVALPFYHGFGLGVLIIAMAMGKKICMCRHFHTEEALDLVEQEQLEVLPIVPTMLTRMWQSENSRMRMKSVKCIISGGDRLDKKIVDETREKLGDVLFNLYGTSEAGFFMMATPANLATNEETTLGKPITGVECDVRERREDGVGTLWVRSKWAMIGAQNQWQNTGDLVYRNEQGYYFHRGIAKNMVVCGGENVYPEGVELVINQHPAVVNSKVYAVPNTDFGYVLNAQVELKSEASLSECELKEWLRNKLARAEMPHHIVFKEIALLSTGKKSSTIA
ncbi:MAG: AMP-binding protein [Paludibacteraceae bacterium]|nr:AMP-binding protein [Paludibacteraceae bacterium]